MGLSPTSDALRLLGIWDEALGPLAEHCRPDGLRNGIVRASVRDSAWMQRVQFEKPRILAALGAALGDPPKELRLRIGPVDRR